MGERIILLVDMDAFFASCEQATDPRLSGKPVIVCGNPKTRTVVAACSYEAKARGVDNGMSVHEAMILCPTAVLVPGNPEKYIDVARRIFSTFDRFTPLVEIVSIDEAFLDVTDTWTRFGASEEVAHQIQKEIETRYALSCTVGIGPNKLLAKLAAKLHKPHGIGRIRGEEVPACLAQLPVESISGIGHRLSRALRAMGVVQLGELAQVPVGELTHRFGFYGELLHRMALGIDESPVRAVDAPDLVKSMGHSYTLEKNTTDLGVVGGMLLKLSEKVARRLRQAGCAARTVTLTVRFSDFTGFNRQRKLGEFVNDGLTIYRAAWRLLSARESPRPIRLVGVSVSTLGRVSLACDLWEDQQRRQRLLRSLDRINDFFGEETLLRAGACVPFVPKTRGYFDGRWFLKR